MLSDILIKKTRQMTLVIARKKNNHISISSDSRVSFGKVGNFNHGVKVFSFPAKIYGPTDFNTGISELVYAYNLGLAFTGSTTNALTVKESIYEILQNLQYVPGYTEFNLNSLANIILKVYNKTTLEIGQIIREDGLSELIFSGYCPEQQRIRIFHFSYDASDFPIRTFYNEILNEDGIVFFGSGKRIAENIHSEQPTLSIFHILKKVINDENEKSVGGGIQYGEFSNNNFKIYGVEDYETNNDNTFKEYLYTLRGINLNKDEFEHDDSQFHISYTFKRPFADEIENIWRQQGID